MNYNTVSLFIIGTELTRGIIEDKHTSRICIELSHLGFEVQRSIIVPDDGSIKAMLETCVNDSDVVVITGGLGPTSDDMTRQIIADEAEVPLLLNQEAWDTLYKRVGERIHGANERQAYIPEGFSILENPNGTAPGFLGYAAKGGREVLLICMPGPPREMQPMFYNLVVPYLARLKGHKSLKRDEYSIFLTAESKLEDLCNQLHQDGVTFGDRFQQYMISLYLSGGEDNKRSKMERDLRDAIGQELMVSGEHNSVDMLCDYLHEKGLTISTAESCTGGWLSKLLTDRPGSSSWFWGATATYCADAKEKLLGVSRKTIEEHSVYSHQCVIEMAEGIRTLSGTDLAIAISGVAGPDGGTTENPVGTVYFGFASKTLPSQSVKLCFSYIGRDFVRKKAAVAASILALMYLRGVSLLDRTSKWAYI